MRKCKIALRVSLVNCQLVTKMPKTDKSSKHLLFGTLCMDCRVKVKNQG